MLVRAHHGAVIDQNSTVKNPTKKISDISGESWILMLDRIVQKARHEWNAALSDTRATSASRGTRRANQTHLIKKENKRRQAPTDFTRAESRDNLRATVLACTTPLVAARCNSGCAARKASCAADLSPDFTASSTLRKKLRTRDFRALFRAVRFSV